MSSSPLMPLVKILDSLGVEKQLLSSMSEALEARLVPTFAEGDETSLWQHVADGIPVLAPKQCAKRVVDTAGADGLAYVCDSRWDCFDKPKVAMIGGWGRPGTIVDAVNDEHLALVRSFSEVLRDSRPLNLQMFHREERNQESQAATEKETLPVLPSLLEWPCADMFHTDQDEGGDSGGANYAEKGNFAAETVDRATRISRKGAITWWHLDDSGEHVFQVALPLDKSRSDFDVQNDCESRNSNRRAADEDIDRSDVVKIFIFAELDDYEFVFQDDETNSTGRVAAINPFTTATNALPVPPNSMIGTSRQRPLPRFWVAPLHAGGAPLLSPPNMPHMVITVRDCVMVEERRVSTFFLDEVGYFLRRASKWHTMPIIYNFLRQDLCNSQAIDRIAATLLEVLRRGDRAPSLAACAKQSLLVLLHTFPWHHRFDAMGLSKSLFQISAEMRRQIVDAGVLQSVKGMPDEAGVSSGCSTAQVPENSGMFTRRWQRHQRVTQIMENQLIGIFDLGNDDENEIGRESLEGADAGTNCADDKPLRYSACVTRGDGQTIWAPARAKIEEAQRDRMRLLLAIERGGDAALSTILTEIRDSSEILKTSMNSKLNENDIFGSSDESDNDN